MDSFQLIFNQVMPLSNKMASVVSALAGIGALFYIGNKVWSSLSRNEPIEMYSLLKPFVICIICTNFMGIILYPMEALLSPISKYTNSLSMDIQKNCTEEITLQRNIAKQQRQEEERQNGQKNWFQKNISDFSIKDIGESLKMWLLKGILWCTSMLREGIGCIVKFIRIVFLMILCLIGPIAFAMSLFGGFGNSITNWLAKYISIYMWLPISNIINAILSKTELVMLSFINSAQANDVSAVGLMITLIFVYAVGALCYLAIPTISTWMIPAGEGGVGLSSVITPITSYIGAQAGAITGASARAAKQGVSKILKQNK